MPQEPRQATAATQPYPVGDAFVTQTLDIPPEGYRLINNGAIFTPFWEDPVMLRRSEANWPPGTVDPEKGIMYVCAMTSRGFCDAPTANHKPLTTPMATSPIASQRVTELRSVIARASGMRRQRTSRVAIASFCQRFPDRSPPCSTLPRIVRREADRPPVPGSSCE